MSPHILLGNLHALFSFGEVSEKGCEAHRVLQVKCRAKIGRPHRLLSWTSGFPSTSWPCPVVLAGLALV